MSKVTEAQIELALDAKVGSWQMRDMLSCDESEHAEVMRIALEAALSQGEAVPVARLPDYVRSAISGLAHIAMKDAPQVAMLHVGVIDNWLNSTHLQPAELSEVSGNSGELEAEDVTLKQVIEGYIGLYGSLRQAAELLCIDHAYMSRLAGGSKTNPSDEVLEKLGLERRVVYTRKVRDYQPTKLHPRTKCA